jgi:hypothetical protein
LYPDELPLVGNSNESGSISWCITEGGGGGAALSLEAEGVEIMATPIRSPWRPTMN